MPEPIFEMNGASDSRLRILGCVYGESGVGKTRLFRTLPGCFLINTERQGLVSIKGSGIKVWDTTRDSVRMSDSLRNAWVYCNAHPEIPNVVLDSVTECQQTGMDEIVGNPEKDTSQRDFGTNYRQIRAIVLAFMKLPQNVWFVAGERAREDEGGPEIIQPDLPPALLRFFKRQITLGLRLTVTRKTVINQATKQQEVIIVPTVQTFVDGRAWGIDRSGTLGGFIPNPDLSAIERTVLDKRSL